ncbi:MAG: PASTA domain-containing protein, partial [Nocardioides sp.]|nr:PASTA domain-containing protein [Nocardioides sp.]
PDSGHESGHESGHVSSHTTTIDRDHGDPGDPAAYDTSRGPSRLRAIGFGVLALLLVAGLAFGHWWFAPFTTAATRYTDTPNVIGDTRAEATDEIDSANLEIEVGEAEYSNKFEKGQVIRTEPASSEKVLDDGSVTIVLSKGVEVYQIPKVRGKSEDQAQALVTEHFEYGDTVERYHPSIPEGQAIRTDPKAGQVRPPTQTIDLIVSKGPRPITLTDWTGKDAGKAQKWFDKRGLEAKVSEEYDDNVPKGNVVSQSPSSGELFKGDEVELVVSQGPELIEVPRVVGMGTESATDSLEEAGFKVKVEHHSGYLGLGYVFSTSPGRGEELPKGSTVTISII